MLCAANGFAHWRELGSSLFASLHSACLLRVAQFRQETQYTGNALSSRLRMTDQEDIVPADVADEEEEDHEDEQDEEPEEEAEEPTGKAAPKSSSRKAPTRTKKAPGNRKKGSRIEQKAGLCFPVSKIRRILKENRYAKSVKKDAGIYLTGVIEYVCAEILELAGNSAKENKKQRIIPRNIQLAIRNDEELNKYMSNVTVRSGGVIPHIHQTLMPEKQQSKGKLSCFKNDLDVSLGHHSLKSTEKLRGLRTGLHYAAWGKALISADQRVQSQF
eukprot:s2083_g9.t1